ncbi:MAG TPA: hypothetical protein VFH59_11140 [Frateuria sp.]|uniref:hypothetical protein n=1 Tax=Frateuria sp. TaxID=2211372 RepID=UPI002D7F165B|nr:hypothetical protein [Frateuria sp.]HET6805982.1 hypothetical protein [Frateuria sp.]
MSLQLETCFYTSVEVDANPGYREADHKVECKVEINGELNFVNAHRLGASLSIAIAESDGMPYDIALFMFAGFTIHDDTLAQFANAGMLERALDQYKNSAVSICYGAAREFVLMVTGRQPWGPFTLPVVYPSTIELAITLGDEVKGLAKISKRNALTPRAPKKKASKQK